jgi:hypothetical protein
MANTRSVFPIRTLPKGLYFSAIEELSLESVPFETLAKMLGRKTTEEVELLFSDDGLPSVSSDVIRAHSYLDENIFRVKGYGEGSRYTLYSITPSDDRSYECLINLPKELEEKILQILGVAATDKSKLILKNLTHEHIASINDEVMPVNKIEYTGLTADELLRMTYDPKNLEKIVIFYPERGLSGMPARRTKIEIYRDQIRPHTERINS